ncbi:MAG TPA: phage tail protein [Bradyrhizobium sp.]|jgi:phage tail-like protein|nr:phage tail protein [Bradyrhizobium sp.]
MAIDPSKLDPRAGQLSRLLGYLPAIFQERPADADPAAPLPLGRFLMAFESILLGLPRNSDGEIAELRQQPGLEEIIGGAGPLLDGIQRYFDPGPGVADSHRAPPEFLNWLAGWVALTVRDDWTDEHKRTFIARAVQLYRLRGTRAGVEKFVKAYTGGLPVEILEQADEFQIADHSQVGVDTVLGGGAPFFFRVILTSSDPLGFQKQSDIVTALIELQKPAHTSFSLEVETLQFQIGDHSQIGVDTLLGTLN